MKKKFDNWMLYGILIIVVVGFIINVLDYVDKSKQKIQSEIENMIAVDNQIDSALDITLSDFHSLSQIHYFDHTARNILLGSNKPMDARTRFTNDTYMNNAISHIIAMNPVVIRASLIATDGRVYSNHTSVLQDYVNFILKEKESQFEKGNTGIYYTEPYDYSISQKKERLISVIYPLNAYFNQEIATLSIDIDYNALIKVINDSIISQGGSYFILNGNKTITEMHKGSYQKMASMGVNVNSYLTNEMKKAYDFDYYRCQVKGKTAYITMRLNQTTGWTIAQMRFEELMLRDVNKKNQQIMLTLTLLFLLTLSVFAWFTKMITRPLKFFEESINDYNGKQLQRITYPSRLVGRDINKVMSSYNNLVDRISTYIDREIIYEKNQRQTQAIALRYQINPHFLFNTLNTICSMGELNDSPEILEVTKNLSLIMQYNIRGSKFVKLKEEIDIVEAYLKIQNVRFGNRIIIQYDIPQRLLQVDVIKFILQPFIENVFSHAMPSDKKKKILIILNMYVKGEFLFIKVKDNGCGIERNTLEKINYELRTEIDSQTLLDEEKWAKSIGLKNVNARIKNYYGNECYVKLESDGIQGTEVVVCLKPEMD